MIQKVKTYANVGLEGHEILLYQDQEGNIAVEVKFENETVWLNEMQIAILFQRDRSVINKHIKNIFREGELNQKSNVHLLHIPNSDKPVSFYDLDVIISVGYRVKSQRGTQFRIRATQRVKDMIIKLITNFLVK